MGKESTLATGIPGELPDEELSEAAAEGTPTPEEEDQELHRKLLSWLYHERDRQAENRMQMAIDHDFVDGLQWSEEDAQEIEARGQAPLVYNEVAVNLRWITGTEKRERTDWRVLPREESDQQAASVKTKVMKYISDVNRVPFVRSQAFEEAVACGLSFLEDNVNADPTEDILYSGWESWRVCLHDSYDRRNDGKGWRYFFRWRDVDLDIAELMFPDRKEMLKSEATDAQQLHAQSMDELWYLGERLNPTGIGTSGFRHNIVSQTISDLFNRRQRVRIYECWYREPEETSVIQGGTYNGEVADFEHAGHMRTIEEGTAIVSRQPVMRMKLCYFLEGGILAKHDSPFKHNDFPFTPIYCFRRGRDGLPYGFVRNQRDPQEDLNKRMSKSLFLLSVNQLIVEKSTFSDREGEYTLQDAIENASNPAGVFVMADGQKRFEIRRDYAESDRQVNQAMMDRQFIQSTSGVTDELLGRKTNAVSGEAIRARQDQGSATTASPFDNYRLAIQVSGSKQLSNAEQFYSMPKVIRLTGEKGAPKDETQWIRINEPELQADGSVRFLNDITATRADFVIDEQDFRASMRQAAFDSLQEMVGKIIQYQPQWAIQLLPLVIDVADFPGKEELVSRLEELANPKQDPQAAADEALRRELEIRSATAKIAKDEAKADLDDASADEKRVLLPPAGVAVDLTRTPQDQAAGGGGPTAGTSSQPAVATGAPPSPAAASGTPNEIATAIAQLAQLTASIQQSMQASNTAIAQALEAVAAALPRRRTK